MQHDFSPELALQNLDLTMGKCNFLNLGTKSKTEYDLPLVMIFIDSEPDKQVKNFTDVCKHAWYDAGSVNVALDQGASLRIGPICADKPSNKSQNVAVVLHDITAGEHDNYTDSYSKNVTNGFFREEPKNVKCFVNTARGETFRHVFTSPLSDPPEGTSCGEQKKTEQQETEQEEIEQKEFSGVTRNPKIGNQTIPYTARTVPVQPDKWTSLHVGLRTLLALVGFTVVAMFAACFSIRTKGYCSRGNHAAKVARSRGNQAAQVAQASLGPPLSIASVNHWMIGGGNSRAVTVNIRQGTSGSDSVSYSQRVSYLGDDQGLQYSEIPDEYYCNNRYENTDTFNRYDNKDTSPPETSTTYWQIPEDYYNYYNTRPASLHHYWEIGDDYYNYENTAGRPLSFPLALQVPLSSGHDDEVARVSFNASAADSALPTVNRLRCKPSSYGTAARGTAVTQNYGVRARNADISSYGTPASERRIALLGRYGRTQRGLCSRDKAMVFYNNPSTAHVYATREQANLMYKASFKIQPRYQNIPCPQYANMPIARSKDDAWMTNYKEGQIRVHRSKTFSMKVPKSRMEESFNKARHRRKSI
ncbi:PREDICTED: uncharacterized protein LOC109488282 [Branchiostoma belcheri]|uniref:Uncharacterized protein LOC109488282 n=1 Tax=Branchiostoma belcheri TaxID=7741 RepID=A0A6P5API0_BRABE|nr:PREDICTED: uncharacterized protein LOC109488282 [Branchiostoma belcheri]